MFQEPKILPWLARKAGVPFAEAREIWRGVASQSAAERGDEGDLAWRQVRELRRQLKEKGRDARADDTCLGRRMDVSAAALSDMGGMADVRRRCRLACVGPSHAVGATLPVLSTCRR